jgi:hypothetical protein
MKERLRRLAGKEVRLHPVALAGLIFFACILCALRFYRETDTFPVYMHGEYLLNSIYSPASISFYMPVKTVSEALFTLHTSADMRTVLSTAFMSTSCFLVFWLAATFAGLPGAIAATLFALSTGNVHEPLYNISILLTALVLALRERHYTSQRNIMLGLAIGFSLLYRSVLALLPPLLVFMDTAGAPCGKKKNIFISRGLPLMALSYSALIPWIIFNLAHFKRFVPFENGGAYSNIIAGAMGTLSTVEGNIYSAADIPPGTSPIAWALVHVLHHPLVYAGAVCRRFCFVYNMHPVLSALTLSGAVTMRKNTHYIRIFLVAAYFTLVYCAFAVEPRYFEPVFPLLAVMAVWPITFIFPHPVENDLRPALAGASAVLAALCAFEIYAFWVLCSYRERYDFNSIPDMTAAAKLSPRNPWLRRNLAQLQIARGEYAAAAINADTALKLAGGIYSDHANDLERIFDIIHLAQGNYRQVSSRNDENINPMTMIFALALEKDASLGKEFRGTWNMYLTNHSMLREASGKMELELDSRLKQLDSSFADDMIYNLLALPVREQSEVLQSIDMTCAKDPNEPACAAFHTAMLGEKYFPNLISISCENKDIRPFLTYELLHTNDLSASAAEISYRLATPQCPEGNTFVARLVTQTGKITARYKKAVQLSQQGNYAESRAKLEKLLKLDPYYAAAYPELGAISRKQGIPEQFNELYAQLSTITATMSRQEFDEKISDILRQDRYLAELDRVRHVKFESAPASLEKYAISILTGAQHDNDARTLRDLIASGRAGGYRNLPLAMLMQLDSGQDGQAQDTLAHYRSAMGYNTENLYYDLSLIMLNLPRAKSSKLIYALNRISLPFTAQDLDAYAALSEMHTALGLKYRPGPGNIPELEIKALINPQADRKKLRLVLSSNLAAGQDAPLLLALLCLDEGDYNGAKAAVSGHRAADWVKNPPGIIGNILEQLPFEKMKLIASRLSLIPLDANRVLHGRFPRYPPEALTLTDAGIIDAQKKNFRKAEKELLRAIELNPHYLPAYSTLGAVYMDEHRADKLPALYKQAVEHGKELWGSPLMDMLNADYSALTSGKSGAAK